MLLRGKTYQIVVGKAKAPNMWKEHLNVMDNITKIEHEQIAAVRKFIIYLFLNINLFVAPS